MRKQNVNETHLSMLVETKQKLKVIADREDRTMRAVITRLINAEYLKHKDK